MVWDLLAGLTGMWRIVGRDLRVGMGGGVRTGCASLCAVDIA